jgi:hypothetical protein
MAKANFNEKYFEQQKNIFLVKTFTLTTKDAFFIWLLNEIAAISSNHKKGFYFFFSF